MPSVTRKTRRKLYLFVFAIIYALVFFEVGIMYQENNNKTRHEAGKKIIQESKMSRRKELLSDFHHEPHILLKSVLKGETVRNDTSFAIKKTTSTSESFKKVKYSRTGNSDVLVF